MRQQIHKSLQQIVVAENRTFEITAQASEHQSSEVGSISSNEHSSLSELLSLVVLGVFLLVYTILCRRMFNPKKAHTSLRCAKNIPCKYCRFFSSNPYLHCAVHPSRALKLDAIHCPDYCPK